MSRAANVLSPYLKRKRKRAARARRPAPAAPPAAAPTPRVRRLTPVQRLARRGVLNIYEHTAADEILHAYHVSVGVGGERDDALGLPRSAPRAGGAEHVAAWRIDLLRVFHQWKAELRGRAEFDAAIAVLIEERPLRDLDAAAGTRKGTSKERMLAALRHFAALRGNTPRGVRWRL